jgi:hypothetical protein
MICKFFPGQKVVCINDDRAAGRPFTKNWKDNGLDGLKKGNIYTVKCVHIHRLCSEPLVQLVEIQPRGNGFWHGRFKPLESKGMDVFYQILKKANNKQNRRQRKTVDA